MKKLFLYAVTGLAMASCTSDELVETINTVQTQDAAGISFKMKTPELTRATTGADAATLLNKKFVVYGEKGDPGATPATHNLVFGDYDVLYNTSNSAQADYNAGWYYVGAKDGQTIKYWDYAEAKYTFTAYSTGTLTGTLPTITRQADAAGYKVEVTDAATLPNLFFSDKTTVEKAKYGQPVTLNFKRLGAKVRVGVYENVPGYAVKDLKFYSAQTATTALDAYEATLIAGDSKPFNKKGTFTVGYTTEGKVTVSFAAATTGGTEAYHTFGDKMTLTTHPAAKAATEKITAADGTTATTGTATASFLGQTSLAPSWADATTSLSASNYYFDVFPNETGMGVVSIKADYTLVSIDGSKETINVKGASAYIPADYTKWNPNTAYTYLFKITENTNGTTGDPTSSTDKAGLYPIVFDAVVADVTDVTQGTITTVSTPSITTYQDGSVVAAGIEYHAGDITVKVMNGTTETDGYTINCYKLAAAYDYTKTLDANIGSATDILSSGKFTAESGQHYVIKASKRTTDASYALATSYDPSATYYTRTADASGNNGVDIVGGNKYTAASAGTVTEANYGSYYVKTAEVYTTAYKVVDVAATTVTITLDTTAKKATVAISGAADNTLTATNKLTSIKWVDSASAETDGTATYVNGKAVIAYPTTAGTYTLKVTYGGVTKTSTSITVS